MVSNPVVRPVVCPNFFTYISCTFLIFSHLCLLFKELSIKVLVEPLSKNRDSFFFIFGLFSRVLVLSSDPSGYMSSSACTICFVDMLTASTLCPIKVKLDFFHIDSEITWDFRHNHDDTSAGVESAFDLSLRNTLNFVHA